MTKICLATILINLTPYPWNNFDKKTLQRAKKTCIVTYQSCLKKLIKTGERDYRAICGEFNENRKIN